MRGRHSFGHGFDLKVILSTCDLVIFSSCHLVILSSCPLVILSSCQLAGQIGGPKRFHDSFNFVFYIVGECISCAADTHLATDLT